MITTTPPTGPIARRAQLIALGVLAATAASSGCAKGTYLEIDFKGMGLPPVRQINLTLVDNSNMKYSAGVLPDGVDAASTELVKFPSSAAFQLNDLPGGTPLAINADAISPANALVAHAGATTSVMHAKTWKVTLDFTPGVVELDGGPPDGDLPTDASDDGRSLVTITDGSVEDASGCVAATIEASESVSLDYESSGPTMDAGNNLWATLGPQERFIGWTKFGLRFIPNAFRITKATLNLTVSQIAAGLPPTLLIRWSSNDGWTRKSSGSNIPIDEKMSDLVTLPPTPPAIVSFPLDVTAHKWPSDIVDGTITLGVENMTALTGAVATSRAEFYGVPAVSVGPNRPTLDIEFCR